MSARKPKWNTTPFAKLISEYEGEKIRGSFDKLRKALSLKTNRMSYEQLIAAIDDAAENFLMAYDLYLIALNEELSFKTYYEIQMADLSEYAQIALEEMKTKKEITGQITQELRRNWIIKNKRTEFNDLEQPKRELRIARKRLEALKESWSRRTGLLQSQAKAVENKRQVILGGKS